MFVVFDLDDTLALTEHRAHHLNQDPKDWRGFYAACDGDEPFTPIIAVAMALNSAGHDLEIWSGRSEEVRAKTEAWLKPHGILGALPLRMRPEGDHQPDIKLKAAWLDEGRTPDLVFEDRGSMVSMYRDRGIACCQVAPGDF